jgi:hypothetical protein
MIKLPITGLCLHLLKAQLYLLRKFSFITKRDEHQGAVMLWGDEGSVFALWNTFPDWL